jgi:hypothetical protein
VRKMVLFDGGHDVWRARAAMVVVGDVGVEHAMRSWAPGSEGGHDSIKMSNAQSSDHSDVRQEL